MGQLTITPSYVDLSAGVTWASLGGSQAAAKAAVQQVCDDIKAGTRTTGADIGCVVKVGLSAYPTSAADTTGLSIGGNAGQSAAFTSSASKSWANYLSFLLGLSGPNTLQQTAWNGLPGSGPTVDAVTWTTVHFAKIVLGMFNPSDAGYTDNVTLGGIGINASTVTDYDQHGLGSGKNFYGVAFHEITEAIFERNVSGSSSAVMVPWDLYSYTAVATRGVTAGTARYLSQDGGTTNIASMNAGAGDAGDFAALSGDAWNANVITGAVSRDASTPLQQRDWQAFSLYVPFSTTGNSWAGVATPSCSVNPSIGGTLKTGNTLTVTPGTWSNSPTLTYQWKKNGSNIGGATSITYTPTNADRDALFSCDEIANASTDNVTATAASVGPWLVNSRGAFCLNR